MTALPPGYRVGHAEDGVGMTGCTVILPPAGTIAAVDVRGGSPGTRETGVFAPGNLISEIHALVFAGGSAFGLAAANGVTAWLRERSVGVPVGPARVPIVAAAVLFDLAVGDPNAFPDEAMGRRACDAASASESTGSAPRRGRIGAGAGATVGKLLGAAQASPGGIGVAAQRLPDGSVVAALVAVNAFGDVVDPDTGAPLAGPRRPSGVPYSAERALREDARIDSPLEGVGANTTLVCVATTVPFDTGSLKRVAIEAHDGIARAVRPAHTVVDGDVAFALAPPGPAPALLARLRVGAAAAHVVARAIADAVARP
ncbi:MAG TPA: P1 family peptidase [Thermoanaerobaculia bacterium]